MERQKSVIQQYWGQTRRQTAVAQYDEHEEKNFMGSRSAIHCKQLARYGNDKRQPYPIKKVPTRSDSL